MQSMYLLIPLSLVLFVFGIWAVYYAIKSHQFDDLDNAAQRIILDDRQERREQLASTISSPETLPLEATKLETITLETTKPEADITTPKVR